MSDDPRLGRVGNRPFWIRTGSVFIRAAHLLAASAVLGALLWRVEDAAGTRSWWIVAGVSGVLLVVAELARHRELYREVAGWSTVLKLLLIGSIALLPTGDAWLMSAAFVVAVVGAHGPRVWRHRKLF